MSGDMWAAAFTTAVLCLPFGWLLGYRRGHDDAVNRAVDSLRFSALLSRANGYGSEREVVRAEALEAAAERAERRLIGRKS